MSQHVAVLMGGWGEEREISIRTGEAVVAALESLGHRVSRVFAGPGLDRALRTCSPEVAFNALHGRMGEDGRVQGLLEVLEVPYTGSGVLASALAMNKTFAKRLFQLHNLATPAGYTLGRSELPKLIEKHADLGFPCVVKPALGGSSVGLSLVHRSSDLLGACERAMQYGGAALVERFVKGREVTVGILEDRVLGTCEIEFTTDTFDFVRKYQSGSHYFVPARLSGTRRENVETQALAASRSLGCRGYARVDILVSEEDNEQVLEVNTLPGLTPMSLLPKIAAHAGLSFTDLVARILASAGRDESAHVASAEEHSGYGLFAHG